MTEFEKNTLVLESWKKTIEVQQHFNDLSLRIRSFYITALGGLLASIGFLIKEKVVFDIFGHLLSATVIVVIVCVLVVISFWFMDRLWYHRLLVGSVNHGLALEEKYKNIIPELKLTCSIKDASAFTLCGFKIGSSQKIDIFYFIGMIVVAAVTILLFHIKPSAETKIGQESIVPKSVATTNIPFQHGKDTRR